MSTISQPVVPLLPASHAERVARLNARESRAQSLERWQRPDRHYYRELIRLLRMHIPAGSRVLQVSCGMGDLLNGVAPSLGVGVDVSAEVVDRARLRYPHLSLRVGDPESLGIDEKFDYVIIGDAVVEMVDVQASFEQVRRVCTPATRVIVTYINPLWYPALRALSAVGLRRRAPAQNWLSTQDVLNLLNLSGFEVVCHKREMILPARIPLLTGLCNRLLARVWPTKYLSLVHMLIARPVVMEDAGERPTCSVVIPARNERGHIESAVRRTPEMGGRTEIIFVEGGSTDGTADEIRRVIAANPNRDIKLLVQDGKGKGDAVRKGFSVAHGDVLMILDADLTVQPEELPKFYECVASGRAEFVNGTRLVYPMDAEAMRLLNKWANWAFSVVFSWLIGQKFRDTLCGTKVLRRKSYETITRNRAYFGALDPFGDFDLILGAAKANLKIVEIPVRYKARTYGETNISRFRHGFQLLRMAGVAMCKLKFR